MSNILPFKVIGVLPENVPDKPEQPQEQSSQKIFMTTKEFAKESGAPYNKVRAWVYEGMPILPGTQKPFIIIVPAAIKWLKEKYGF